MMDQKSLEALTSSIYLARLQLNGGSVDTDDKRIRVSGLYDEWTSGSHAVGEICNATVSGDAQTWECYQAHNNAIYPDINPQTPAWFTFWRPLHGTSPETARPWVAPTHSMDIYKVGEHMIFTDGQMYRCKSDTSFSPSEYAAAWESCAGEGS